MDLKCPAVSKYTIFNNLLVTADLEVRHFKAIKADEFKRCISHVTAYVIYMGVICALDTSFFSLTYCHFLNVMIKKLFMALFIQIKHVIIAIFTF